MQIKESLSGKATLPPNTKLYDSSSKIIFEDNLLCSQFLRDYIDLAPQKMFSRKILKTFPHNSFRSLKKNETPTVSKK